MSDLDPAYIKERGYRRDEDGKYSISSSKYDQLQTMWQWTMKMNNLLEDASKEATANSVHHPRIPCDIIHHEENLILKGFFLKNHPNQEYRNLPNNTQIRDLLSNRRRSFDDNDAFRALEGD